MPPDNTGADHPPAEPDTPQADTLEPLKQGRLAKLLSTHRLPEKMRKPFTLTVGATLIILGLALVVLPGPFTLPLVIAGFAVLSTEFTWAERALEQSRDGAKKVGQLLKHPIILAAVVTLITVTIILGIKYGWFALLLDYLPFTR